MALVTVDKVKMKTGEKHEKTKTVGAGRTPEWRKYDDNERIQNKKKS